VSGLERGATFNQNAVGRAHTSTDHDSGWGGEAEGAGARHHYHTNREEKREEERGGRLCLKLR